MHSSLNQAFPQTLHWILSQLACYGCPALRGIMAPKLYEIGRSLISQGNVSNAYGNYVRNLVYFSRMLDQQWITMHKHLLYRSSRVEFLQALDDVESRVKISNQPAQEYPVLVLLMNLRLVVLRRLLLPELRVRMQNVVSQLAAKDGSYID